MTHTALSELSSYGLIIDDLILDSLFHAVPTTDSPRKKKGWYIGQTFTQNGRQRTLITYGDWSIGDNQLFKSWDNSTLSDSERVAIKSIQDKQRLKAAQQQAAQHETTAIQAAKEWATFAPSGESEYLNKKGVKAYGLRFGRDFVVMPLRTIESKIYSFQRIYTDNKLNLKGGRKKGCFHLIGDIKTVIYFTEGYATAATIHEATGQAVVVCLDAGNIEPVIKEFRSAHPELSFVIAADNDQYKTKNTGIEAAAKAAKLHNARYCFPTFKNPETKPTDFNDLMKLEGVKQVIKQLKPPSKPKAKKYLSATHASEQLKKLTTDFFSNNNSMVLKASAGSGKTFATIAATSKTELDGQLHFFAPTHKLCEEITKDLKKSAPHLKIIHQYGREGHEKMSVSPLCQRNDIANELIKAGQPLYKSLCDNGVEQCPFFNDCAFIKQTEARQDADVVISPHAYLGLNHSENEVKPTRVVIDESFLSEAISASSGKISDIIEYTFFRANDNQGNFINAMNATSSGDAGFLDALRKSTGLDSEELVIECKEILNQINTDSAPHRPRINPTMSDKKIKKQVSRVKLFSAERRLLGACIKELEKYPTRSHSRLINVYDDSFTVRSRSEKNRLNYFVNNSIPVLLIDADANKTILNKLIGANDFHEINVKRKVTVNQCIKSSFAKTRFTHAVSGEQLTRSTLKKIVKIANGRETLIVTYKDVREEIEGQLPINISIRHFNDLRGIDAFKHHKCVIVVGRNEPPAYAMENIAAALYWDSEEELLLNQQYRKEAVIHRAVNSANNSNGATNTHPDKRVQEILELHRESEILQAVDRLRFIHGKDEAREVFILTDVALDIEVNNFINHEDYLPKKADVLEELFYENNGVLILSPTFLWNKYGAEKFVNLQQVKDILKKGIHPINSCILGGFPLITYRTKSQKQGKHLTAKYDPRLSLKEVINNLEIQHSESIRVIEEQKPETKEAQPAIKRVNVRVIMKDGTKFSSPNHSSLLKAKQEIRKKWGDKLQAVIDTSQPNRPTFDIYQGNEIVSYIAGVEDEAMAYDCIVEHAPQYRDCEIRRVA